MIESVAQATDDDGLICAASVTQNRAKLNHADTPPSLELGFALDPIYIVLYLIAPSYLVN